ncbi:Queuosine Biosynthesis QueE Radical SAM [Desulfurella amilsii]|uniref:7-carboxy-7-deazaguanine synthase n=1 Tax=Desulfurella amilsii TaxID=1562698 RepID=A0A1X4XV41_9BACT|nr:7-carboxy-7-deazaguanine synthase QueE [Desulfurella amilsii]OSS41407.1 Queuosine Biosynthesis QueE Radical SAM [Desulfurella amilsii]
MQDRICEIFYSLQLEGAMLGYPAVFVRFSGCNLNCDFCDTKYAFDEYKIMSLLEVEEVVSSYRCKRIIFTGGEPLLHASFIELFIKQFKKKYEFFLETNGTIWVDFASEFDHIVVSPKFDSLNYEVLENYKTLKNVEFKILVQNAQSLKDIETFFKNLNLISATIQPIYFSNEPLNKFIKRTQDIVEAFKKSNLANSNVRLIIQNHKIIYAEQRGV